MKTKIVLLLLMVASFLTAQTMPDSTNILIRRAIASNDADLLNRQSLTWMTEDIRIARLCARFAYGIARHHGTISQQVDALNNLGDSHFFTKTFSDSATYYYQKAYELSQDGDYTEGMQTALWSLVYVYNKEGKYAKALEHLDLLKPLYGKNDRKHLAEVASMQGSIHEIMGNYDLALEDYYRSLEDYTVIKDTLNIADSYNNLGNVYLSFQGYDMAFDSFQRADTLYQKIHSKEGLSYIANNMGIVFSDRGDEEKALVYHQRSLELAKELGDSIGVATSYNNIGNSYYILKHYADAEMMYRKSLTLSRTLNEEYDIANTLDNIAELYLATGKNAEAKALLDEASLIINKNKFHELYSDNLKILGLYYKKVGNYREALKAIEDYHTLRDKMFNSRLCKIGEIQTRYETRQKQEIIERLKLQKKAHTTYMRLMIIGFILLLIAITIFWVINKQREHEIRRREEMEIQKLRSDQVQNIIYRIADASIKETELQKFFAEVHQALSTLINTDNFFIALFNEKSNEFYSPYFTDNKDSFETYSASKTLSEYVLRQNKPIMLNREDIEKLHDKGILMTMGTPAEQWLGVPLVTHSDIKGVLALQSYSSDVVHTRDELQLLQAVSIQVALVLDKRKAAVAIRESEEKLRSFLDSATDAFLIWDSHLLLVDANPEALKWLKHLGDFSQLQGKHISWITPKDKDHDRRVQCYEEVLQTGRPYLYKYQVDREDGHRVYYQVNAFRMGHGLGMSIADITEISVIRANLEASLKEKNMLLKEIHHRVKNNMQVISSLLNLQSRYIKHEQSLDYFKQSIQRVNTMALVQEKLYQSKNLADIDMEKYVKEFVDRMHRTWRMPETITIQYKIAPIRLGIDAAVPFGLILNELLANALKHGFVGRANGEIFIGFSEDAGEYCLIVNDNGVGLPESISLENATTLGMQLVHSLTSQLFGKVEVNRSGGTRFTIRFGRSN